MATQTKPRILVIDDNPAIHEDFRKILCQESFSSEVDQLAASVFGPATNSHQTETGFEVDSAHQGEEGLAKLERSLAEGRPYALAFVDGRMPPGWDGVQTIGHLWKRYPELQVVICTAYSDYSWEQISSSLGHSDRLVILKKPFDTVEVLQLAHTMTKRWSQGIEARRKLEDLEGALRSQTSSSKENESRSLRNTRSGAGSSSESQMGRKLELRRCLQEVQSATDQLQGSALTPAQQLSVAKLKAANERLQDVLIQFLDGSDTSFLSSLTPLGRNDPVPNLQDKGLRP